MQYYIRVQGHLDLSWQSWFAGLELQHEPDGTTLLWGPLPDQAALYGVLLKINGLGLVLLYVDVARTETPGGDGSAPRAPPPAGD